MLCAIKLSVFRYCAKYQCFKTFQKTILHESLVYFDFGHSMVIQYFDCCSTKYRPRRNQKDWTHFELRINGSHCHDLGKSYDGFNVLVLKHDFMDLGKM